MLDGRPPNGRRDPGWKEKQEKKDLKERDSGRSVIHSVCVCHGWMGFRPCLWATGCPAWVAWALSIDDVVMVGWASYLLIQLVR